MQDIAQKINEWSSDLFDQSAIKEVFVLHMESQQLATALVQCVAMAIFVASAKEFCKAVSSKKGFQRDQAPACKALDLIQKGHRDEHLDKTFQKCHDVFIILRRHLDVASFSEDSSRLLHCMAKRFCVLALEAVARGFRVMLPRPNEQIREHIRKIFPDLKPVLSKVFAGQATFGNDGPTANSFGTGT